jgi:hypothetical protein
MNMPSMMPDNKNVRAHQGANIRQPINYQNNSQGSDNDNTDLNYQANQHMNAAGNKAGNDVKRPRQSNGNLQYGSEEGSEDGNQVQQPAYNYQPSMNHHSPYQHPGYNYQMPAQAMRGGQGYGMYSPYSPMTNQRPPMKQYQQPGAYNYQGRGGYRGAMNMKGMPRPQAPPAEYYDEHNYEAADHDSPQMRGGYTQNSRGFHAARPVKDQKPATMGQHPAHQYANHHMSSMYQPIHQSGQYDPRSSHDYAPYKPNQADTGMSPGQPPYYNYKHPGMPSYGTAGGQQFGKHQGQGDSKIDLTVGQKYREENQQAAGTKAKPTMNTHHVEVQGSTDYSKQVKIGKAKQFTEDFDSN